MKNDDIRQLLESCDSQIISLSEQIKKGKVNKVLVKNTLENMRSALDYLAKDILLKLKSYPQNSNLSEKVYFPYGQHENHFKISIKTNLKPLKQFEPKIYDAIEAVQPFKSKNNWVVDLCLLTNDAKHNNLSKTESHRSYNIEQKGLVSLRGVSGNITLSNNYINGVRQDDVFINNNDIRVVQHSGTTEIYIENKIRFMGKELEIAPFLTHCLSEIKVLVSEVSKLL